jgi:hypothetical protein
VITIAAAMPITICNPTPAQVSAAFGNATATDNCGTVIPTGVLGPETLVTGCTYQVIKTWTAIDACNNSSTASQTVSYTKDVTAPVITIAAATPITICNPTPAQVSTAFGNATATDNCGVVTPTGVLGTETLVSGCTYQVIKTWTAVDACGNSATASQTVSYTRDVTAPVITIAPFTPITICNPTAANITAAFGNATATDACGTVTPTGVEGSETLVSGCTYQVIKTWTAVDACGNSATASQTVSYTRDVTAPVITIAPFTPITICNPTAANITAAFGNATATDACGTVTPTGVEGSETLVSGCTYQVIKTWTAVDACGNSATASQTVSYTRDVTAPVITIAPFTPITICNPTAANITAAFGNATATDACGTVTPTGVEGSETLVSGCTYQVIKTWTAVDACGNSATASQTVSYTRDVTAPVITIAPFTPITICNPTAANITAAFGNATATDACGTVTPTGVEGSETLVSGCTYQVIKTWTAVDACGNSATASQTVSYTRDVTAPVITIAPFTPITICNPTAANITAAFGNATATDACGTVTPTGVEGSETLVSGCTYQVIKTWTAVDACGNSATASQTVSYTRDVTAPVITIAPFTPITICNPTAANITAAFGNATATDACGTVTPTGVEGSETLVTGCTYQVIKTWTAIDACNNSSTASQTVTYTKDVTAPVITIAAFTPITFCNPTPAQVSAAFGNATATDNCGTVTPTGVLGAETLVSGCTYQVIKTWTAIDACNNSSIASQTVTYTKDVTAPVITIAAATSITICNPTPAQVSAAFGNATATDNCSVATATGTVQPEVVNGCTVSVTKTWTATDACGNTGTASQTITFTRDNTLPVITLTAPSTVACNAMLQP